MEVEQISKFSSKIKADGLLAIIEGYQKAQFFYQAFSTNIFEKLTNQLQSIENIAKNMECQPERIELLLNALTSLGLVEKTNTCFGLTALSATYLRRGSSFYLGDFINLEFGIKQNDDVWKMLLPWLKGDSRDQGHQPNEVFNTSFIRAMAQGVLSENSITKTMDLIGNHTCFDGEKKLLDLGGGHGLFSIALQKKHHDLNLTIFDLPQVEVITREYAKNYNGVVNFSPGNFYMDDLPSHQDVILAFDILHPVESSKKTKVFKKVFQALNSGGMLFYKLWFLDENRIDPSRAAIFSLKCKITNTSSHVYTLDEATEMLREIGFEIENCLPFDDNGSTIIVARKA
jgi:hypothetical protein